MAANVLLNVEGALTVFQPLRKLLLEVFTQNHSNEEKPEKQKIIKLTE